MIPIRTEQCNACVCVCVVCAYVQAHDIAYLTMYLKYCQSDWSGLS